MIEKKVFYGGLNSDDEDRVLVEGDYRYALNIRNSKSDKSSVGTIENTRGNTPVVFTLPNGISKCVGSKYDEKNNRVIFFIQNSLSFHTVYEYVLGTGIVTNLIQSALLNFDRNYPILHCDIIDNLCYWTDEFNPPRKINIERAKSGGYTTITEQTLDAIQYAPNYSPVALYGTDLSVRYNKVRGKVFQFKYSFVYDDNEISAFSPVSKVAIPPNQALYTFGGYYETSLDNHIQITLETGNYLCKRIQIICREGNTGDWSLVKELDKSELSIADNVNYVYSFFNDEVFIPITQASANRLFDNVPFLAGAQAMIDGNRLAYSDVTDGVDNIEMNATAVAVYNEYPAAINSRLAKIPFFSPPSYVLSVVDSDTNPLNTSNQVTKVQRILINANTVNQTDVWNFTAKAVVFNTSDPSQSTIVGVYDSFVKMFTPSDNSQTIAQYFANEINNSPQLNQTVLINNGIFVNGNFSTTATISLYSAGVYQVDITYNIDITFNVSSGLPDMTARFQTGANITTNIIDKTFKHNSRHSFAVVYYDNPNRSGVCQVSDEMDMRTFPYSSITNRGVIEMDLTIFNNPPAWATHYQILYTGNRTVSNYLQIDNGTVLSQGAQLKVYINGILTYNIASGGKATLAYSWAKGDRITFIKDNNGNFYNEFYDLEIISSSSDSGGQYIIVDNVLPITPIADGICEIYTPKLNTEQIFYWEMGEVYPITGGFHVGNTQNQTSTLPAIIRIKGGDSYFRYRGFNVNSFVEDYSISDYYTSNVWDKGRFNVVDKDYKRIRRYATTYYSEQYVPDTNINGLSVIYDTNFHEANKAYGAIQKTYAEQDRLLFCQEIRTGFSLVNKDVLYNSDGTPNGVVGQANQVLSEVQYYNQPYGIGRNPESFAVSGTRKYFVDPNHGYVLRLSIDGFTEISEYKYHNYFQNMFTRRKQINHLYLGKIWGVFDTRFDEYVLAFEKCQFPDEYETTKTGTRLVSGEILINSDTVSFCEEKKRWVTHYSYKPENMLLTGIDIMTWENGSMYLHNKNNTYNNFYGVQYDSQIEILSNADPSNIKVYESMFTESTDAWSVVLTNQYGQESELAITDFELNEGVYYAAFLKDLLTPNIANPLIEGDDLRCHSMTLKLTNTNTGFVKMLAVTVRYVYSEMTNK